VKASNSCVGTLIFVSFFFIVLCQSFFFGFVFYCLFSLCRIGFCFYQSFVFPLLFRHCFIPGSLAHVVSSLAYPNLLETKRLGCCCCCILFYQHSYSIYVSAMMFSPHILTYFFLALYQEIYLCC
jgi:hypothetical protein